MQYIQDHDQDDQNQTVIMEEEIDDNYEPTQEGNA